MDNRTFYPDVLFELAEPLRRRHSEPKLIGLGEFCAKYLQYR